MAKWLKRISEYINQTALTEKSKSVVVTYGQMTQQYLKAHKPTDFNKIGFIVREALNYLDFQFVYFEGTWWRLF